MTTDYDQHQSQRGYQQYDQHGYQQQRPSVPERGRAIRLMRNGDPYFVGRAFVINQRKYPMLEVFLDDASQSLRANFGAVRCIYTPKHGTRLKDVSDFEDHRTYVAGGGEKFKKLHYLDIAEGKRIANKGQTAPKLPPVRRIEVEGRALKLSRSENVIIHVYRNGDPLTLPAKILLVKPTLQNWESVLDEITKKVSLSHTAVLKLYAMNGELLTSAQQLEYNGMYVAAGKERFRRIAYPDPKSFSTNSSPKLSRKSVRPPMRLPSLQRKTDDSNVDHNHPPISSDMQQRFIKSDGTYTYTTNTATSYGSTENPGQRRPAREEYDFFNNKPQQHRRGPVKETDLDRDDGGIYKGRLNHRERVREIDETRDTKVDLPVDHRFIETVDEENFYANTEKNPRRLHQPANQLASDPRQRAMKSPSKHYTGDDSRYLPHNNRNNSYETNGYNHRTPTQIDDDLNDQHSSNIDRRQSFITSSTLANKNSEEQAATIIQSHVRGYLTRKQTQQAIQQRRMNKDELGGYQYCQPSPTTNKRGYQNNHDNA